MVAWAKGKAGDEAFGKGKVTTSVDVKGKKAGADVSKDGAGPESGQAVGGGVGDGGAGEGAAARKRFKGGRGILAEGGHFEHLLHSHAHPTAQVQPLTSCGLRVHVDALAALVVKEQEKLDKHNKMKASVAARALVHGRRNAKGAQMDLPQSLASSAVLDLSSVDCLDALILVKCGDKSDTDGAVTTNNMANLPFLHALLTSLRSKGWRAAESLHQLQGVGDIESVVAVVSAAGVSGGVGKGSASSGSSARFSSPSCHPLTLSEGEALAVCAATGVRALVLLTPSSSSSSDAIAQAQRPVTSCISHASPTALTAVTWLRV